MVLDGCHEGKHTPKLSEVRCPKCGEWVEVFIKLGGIPGQTGMLIASEVCSCGEILPMGSYEMDYKR